MVRYNLPPNAHCFLSGTAVTPAVSPRAVSVLLISCSYPPVLGGSEIEAQRVCAGLIRRRHKVKVLCAGSPPMPDAKEWTDPYGVPVRIFARGWEPPAQDYRFAAGVAWTLWRERRNYDVAYFLMQGLHLAVGLPVARALGKPVVMKVSGSGLITRMRQSRLGRLELRWLQRWAHRVMILNQGMEDEALAAGFRREHLYWMPNPVDPKEFSPPSPEDRRALRERLGVAPGTPVAVYVGRLAPEKQLSSLFKAWRMVAGELPGAQLVLVGDGAEGEALAALASELGIAKRVRFAGRRTVEEVRDWLRAADVFALVSSNEGFSCSLAEAMSVGLPAVVSDISANTQLVAAGVHGLHAGVGDEGAIAAALRRLLSDGELRAAMGQAARRRIVENYSTDKVLDRYEAVMAEAVCAAEARF
jgi:glycosyltransferase involved in cell wall biosynthesis